jgi:hypothetical protein
MMRCSGSGRKVYDEDEPDGTFQYMHPKCGRSFLPMKKTVMADGEVESQFLSPSAESIPSVQRVGVVFRPIVGVGGVTAADDRERWETRERI